MIFFNFRQPPNTLHIHSSDRERTWPEANCHVCDCRAFSTMLPFFLSLSRSFTHSRPLAHRIGITGNITIDSASLRVIVMPQHFLHHLLQECWMSVQENDSLLGIFFFSPWEQRNTTHLTMKASGFESRQRHSHHTDLLAWNSLGQEPAESMTSRIVRPWQR